MVRGGGVLYLDGVGFLLNYAILRLGFIVSYLCCWRMLVKGLLGSPGA